MKKYINNIMHSLNYKLLIAAIVLCFVAPCAVEDVLAQQQQNITAGTCTNSSNYDINFNQPGLFSTIQKNIYDTLYPTNGESIPQSMFESILGPNSSVPGAIEAAATLYIAIYGLMFTFGMVQVTAFELIIRLAKIGVVATLLGNNSWNYFSNTFVNFFSGGTDEIINAVTSVAVGGLPDTTGGPFGPMDYAIAMIISPKMAATMIGAATTGPYGPGIFLILLLSLVSFIKSLMNAMWVYVMALVMRTFLFALAPIFIPCILFARTKNLFDGWLSQIVNACLQPIFLFSFFSFFAVLFQACLDQLFNHPVCWTSSPEGVRGAPFEGELWRWAIQDCNTGNWVPFDGKWDFNGPENTGCDSQQPVNPMGIMLPLTLWIIADLANRFSDVVVQIAKDIANATTDLRMGAERLGAWGASGGAGAEPTAGPSQGGGGAIGNRVSGSSVAAPVSSSGQSSASSPSGLSSAFGAARDIGKMLVGNRPSK